MTLEAVALLFTGIVVLWIFWRSNKINSEILALLKGLTVMGKEIDDLKQEVRELQKKIEGQTENLPVSEKLKNKNITKVERNTSAKYGDVLVLAEKGFNVTEIADQLAISQDAVVMVLNTYLLKDDSKIDKEDSRNT
ncbi:MAG: hypothetical protein GX434_18300 [Peptococcaceae bacterium]|nr:hypothetical protein [Peptococcaceae bacterium]